MGAKVPGSELARVPLADSLRGAKWPGSEKARYQRDRKTKAGHYITSLAVVINISDILLLLLLLLLLEY